MKERLQKLIASAGVCSRRKAEELIQNGCVTVNGVVASLGESADIASDIIKVNGRTLHATAGHSYLMLNKPKGYITTVSDDRGRPTVMDLLKNVPGRIYPVGRLDYDSEGLLLLTDDGALANALMHPSGRINKVYTVFVTGDAIRASVEKMKSLRSVGAEKIEPPGVSLIESNGSRAELTVVIHEGKNRQIRRMCEQCGLKVTRLIRVAEGALTLGELKSGSWRYLTADEVRSLRKEASRG